MKNISPQRPAGRATRSPRVQAKSTATKTVATRTRKSPGAKLAGRKTTARRPLFLHIRHTGKLVHHQSASHALLLFVLLVVGVLMLSCTLMVHASDDYVVNAVVPGVIPSDPAVIQTPVDGGRFTTIPQIVSGTCPLYGRYVKLYRNNVFSGAALCNNGTFSLQTDLFPDANNIYVKVFNAADQAGPDSDHISAYYDVPSPSVNQPSDASTAQLGSPTVNKPLPSAPYAAGQVPLYISADYAYRGYYVNQTISWDLGISGGKSPYAIHIDWGDGSDSFQRQSSSGQLRISHAYTKPIGEPKSYVIKISASDADGHSTFLQLVVLITLPGTNGIGITTDQTGTGQPQTGHGVLGFITQYAWPTYGVVLLMASSFWFGERHELDMLRKLTHRRPLRHA